EIVVEGADRGAGRISGTWRPGVRIQHLSRAQIVTVDIVHIHVVQRLARNQNIFAAQEIKRGAGGRGKVLPARIESVSADLPASGNQVFPPIQERSLGRGVEEIEGQRARWNLL